MTFFEQGPMEMTPTDAYDIKPVGRLAWLQRLCFKIMKRTGAARIHFDKRHLVTCVSIDREKVTREIVALASIQLHQMGKRPTRILVGRPQFKNFVADVDNLRMGPFQFDIQLKQASEYGSGVTLFSIPVEVIPWMDGVLVL